MQSAYSLAVADWSISPTEFWRMSPQEWWWLFDHKHSQMKSTKKGLGGFSEAEWDDARARHREKMKNGRA